ncbi:MAG: hypothetical protein CL663_09130 [Bacteroidetes bacterium]|nr:hypothetical protein [Bacteroidota bacterium]
MLNFLEDYFYFNQRERRGIFALIILIILGILFNIFMNNLIRDPDHIREQFLINCALIDSIYEAEQAKYNQVFDFDPNTISLDSLQLLGFSKKQAQSILNYRNKGGKFYKRSDFKKMYVVDSLKYERLKEHIQIRSARANGNWDRRAQAQAQTQTQAKILINLADSSELVSIRGIGAVFAKRIIKYRSLLGGYHSKEQLMEVYGLDSLKYQQIEDQILIDNNYELSKLNINKSSFRELLKHPYISLDFTKFIVNRRKEREFSNLNDLFDSTLISKTDFQKLLPYLKLKEE